MSTPLDSSPHPVANADWQRRHEEILGLPPRLEPLAVEEIDADLLMLLNNMIQVNEAINSRGKDDLHAIRHDNETDSSSDVLRLKVANLPEIIRTMLRYPDLFACQTQIGVQLLSKGALPARERELVVLRIGWLCQAPYEWGEHVHVAKSVGLSSEEIERITLGASAAGWRELDRALLQSVDELRSNAMISDETWAVLASHLNEQQLIELPILIGQYQTVAYYQNSLRLRLHEGNPGLKAR